MSLLRPKRLDELIGNENIKQVVRTGIEASIRKNDAFPHTLLVGPPGTGKSTLGNVIANERGGRFISLMANSIRNKKDVRDLLCDKSLSYENHENDPETGKFRLTGPINPTVIFLDEIHQLKLSVQEAFFLAMEDNQFSVEEKDSINGTTNKSLAWVAKFTLIGATTRLGELDKPFIDRFKLKLNLSLYSEDELTKIVNSFCERNGYKATKEAVKEIVIRSRGVARKAVNFSERAWDTTLCVGNTTVINKENTLQTFDILNIDSLGLEETDLQLLKYLNDIYPQKIGVNRLAGVLNTTEECIKDIIEPYLMQQGLMVAAPGGRIITTKGQIYCRQKWGKEQGEQTQAQALRSS